MKINNCKINLIEMKNLNFCKDLFLLVMKISSLLKLTIWSSSHSCRKDDSVDPTDYDLNFCTLSNFYGYFNDI